MIIGNYQGKKACRIVFQNKTNVLVHSNVSRISICCIFPSYFLTVLIGYMCRPGGLMVMRSPPDRTVRVGALAKDIVLCF